MEVEFHYHRLRQLREEKHLTQEQLAELCDCSSRYLRELESGRKRNPSAALLLQVLYALDVPAEDVITAHPYVCPSY